jgi:UDP-N-acetylglucosamine transferase subunit ALG13
MIFVTVGTQLPFDRLIMAMDAWAGKNPQEKVIAQIGNSACTPRYMQAQKSLTPEEFREKAAGADTIVSHAGTGNILLALELGKPVILMPRRAELREHRNDHQLATVRWLLNKPGIQIAEDADSLVSILNKRAFGTQGTAFSPYASDELLAAVKDFINAA